MSAAVPKVVCQLRRARKLAGWLAAEYPGDAPAALEGAENLPERGWVLAAEVLGIDPPSEDTIALTVELLARRVEILRQAPQAFTDWLDEWQHNGGWSPTIDDVELLLTEIDRLTTQA